MTRDAEQKQALETRLREFVGKETGPAHEGPDPVNEAMIHHWCQAMGDRNPIYVDPEAAGASVHEGLVAPPTMLQAWILPGIGMATPDPESTDLQRVLHRLFDEHGYTSVVATNCEQEYHRYLRPGDRVSATTVIESISEEKATALGIGYFINTRTRFTDAAGDELGWMTFRVLKFKPNAAPAAVSADASPSQPTRLHSPRGHDNGWWWDAIDADQLLIQKCSDCGLLRHPPRPMCGTCRSSKWETVPATGSGTVYSFVVMHQPKVPGYDYPLAVAVVDLDEGTRLVANVVGCEPADVHVGMRVQARIEQVDAATKLPMFHPAA